MYMHGSLKCQELLLRSLNLMLAPCLAELMSVSLKASRYCYASNHVERPSLHEHTFLARIIPLHDGAQPVIGQRVAQIVK